MSDSDFTSKALSEATDKKLNESISFLKKEMFNLRFQKAFGELVNTSRFKQVRQDIARISTELSKRKNVGVK